MTPEDAPLAIDAQDITRRFGDLVALAGVTLRIRGGEFFSLLGPSGCGKTTLLRLLAGLDFADSGSLHIHGRDASKWPAHERPVNTVFQSYALFPHLNVFDNVAFGLRMKRVSSAEIATRVSRVMETVQIVGLGERRPYELSGGQKQRVALARAIVNEPKILLLDEPLGALDLKLRKQLQVELHQLQRRLGITFIYVTHDQDEALTMSDRIAVMDHGKIVQLGTPEELYEQPCNRFVAQFLGSCNLLQGRVKTVGDTVAVATTELGDVHFRNPGTKGRAGRAVSEGDAVALAIRPEKVLLGASEKPLPNQVHAKVADLIYSGPETNYLLQAGKYDFKCSVFNSQGHAHFAIGDAVTLHLPVDALIALED